MVEHYECPNCGAINSLWPAFSGRKRFYKCDICGAQYGTRQLDKIWGLTPSTSSISVTPVPRKRNK